METNQIPAVDVDTAAAAAGPEVVLLDVREYEEWMAGHAPEAAHVPMSQLAQRAGELDPSRRYYCLCRSGNRSGRVTQWLLAQGIDAANVAGGMQAWTTAGHPVVNHNGNPGVVI